MHTASLDSPLASPVYLPLALGLFFCSPQSCLLPRLLTQARCSSPLSQWCFPVLPVAPWWLSCTVGLIPGCSIPEMLYWKLSRGGFFPGSPGSASVLRAWDDCVAASFPASQNSHAWLFPSCSSDRQHPVCTRVSSLLSPSWLLTLISPFFIKFFCSLLCVLVSLCSSTSVLPDACRLLSPLSNWPDIFFFLSLHQLRQLGPIWRSFTLRGLWTLKRA